MLIHAKLLAIEMASTIKNVFFLSYAEKYPLSSSQNDMFFLRCFEFISKSYLYDHLLGDKEFGGGGDVSCAEHT